MKKTITIILSILIFATISIGVSAVGHTFTIRDFAWFDCFDADYQSVTIDKAWFESGYAGIVCGPVGSECYLMTRNTTQGDTPMIRFATAWPPTYGEVGQYLILNFSARLYFNCGTPSDLHFIYSDDKGYHDVKLGDYFPVYHQASGVQTCYYYDVNISIPFYGRLQGVRFELSMASTDFIAFSVGDGYLDVVPDPNGAQVEANSMIAEQNSMVSNIASVITGSVNTAPLTSGVDNIVGNVTSMMPDTTDIPYVSDALGSLTQLTNIAAAEIGSFFDPFFTADMTVNIAGVSFNPFLTFLIIGVVITLITFAIKIFTRGDNER